MKNIAGKCAIAAMALAATGCVMDQPAPTQIAAAQSAPTLSGSLEAIRAQLQQQGQISYAIAVRDPPNNRSWTNQFTVEASQVTTDEENCRLGFHWRTTVDGKVVADIDSGLPFGRSTGVTLITMDEDMVQSAAKEGHGAWIMSTQPQIWVVHLTRDDGSQNTVDFHDRASAQIAVDAMRQAIKLCQ